MSRPRPLARAAWPTADAPHLLARHHAALLEARQHEGDDSDVAAHLVVTTGNFGHVPPDHRRGLGRQRMVRAVGGGSALPKAVAVPCLCVVLIVIVRSASQSPVQLMSPYS